MCAWEQVQDEAAGLVVALLDPQPGEAVLDCCAAPGGKALFAAGRMRGLVGVTAGDSMHCAKVHLSLWMCRTCSTQLCEWLLPR